MADSRRLAANIAAGAFSNVVRIGIQIIMLPVMARLLGPEEMGLYALAMPIVFFVLALSDAGLGNSLAQEKSEGTLTWSSAFWALLATGLLLAIAVYAASFLIAAGANQPRLPEVILALSSTLLMVAGTVIPGALMLREGKMSYGAFAELAANIVGAMIALYLAVKGFGVWALVGQYVGMYFMRMVIFNFCFPFLPRFEFDHKRLLHHAHIGGANIGQRLITISGAIGENAIVSRTLGGVALGAYGYANQVARFFSDALGNPLWQNLFYVASNEDRAGVRQHFLRAQRLYAVTMFPSAMVLALSLPTLIPVLLGREWIISIQPMMLLVLAYPFSSLGAQFMPVAMAWRRIKLFLYTGASLALARVIAVVALYPYGLVAVAWGLVVISVAGYGVSAWLSARLFQSNVVEQAKNIAGPFIAALIAAAPMQFLMGFANDIPRAFGAGMIVTIIYVATLYLLDGRRMRSDIASAFRLFKRKQA